jgi:hypothetical protein
VTDVLDDAIRSFLIELVDATPLPPEFDEISSERGLRSHNDASTERRRSRRRSGLVAAAIACAVALAIGAVVALISAGGAESHRPATNSTSQSNGYYYQATTTFAVNFSQAASQSPRTLDNLDQITHFITTGDVPDAVAAKLGGHQSGPQLARRITTKTDQRASTVAITAFGHDPRQAVQLADTFGAELVQVLNSKDTQAYNDTTNKLQVRIDDLSNQINPLIAQVAAQPSNVQAAAELHALQNQYTLARDGFYQLAAEGPPTSQFTVVERARALRINKREYTTRQRAGA